MIGCLRTRVRKQSIIALYFILLAQRIRVFEILTGVKNSDLTNTKAIAVGLFIGCSETRAYGRQVTSMLCQSDVIV